MVAIGVRNSWLASATNCRNRSSLSVRAVSASSILASMVLSALVSRPTSVLAGASSIRREMSPRAIASAVRSMAVSGRSPIRTSSGPPVAVSARMASEVPEAVGRPRTRCLGRR